MAACAPGLWGHAGTNDQPVVAVATDWMHMLAVTAWVGGLAALAWLLLRRRTRLTAEAASEAAPLSDRTTVGSTQLAKKADVDVVTTATGDPNPYRIVGRFSRLAGWALAVVAVTGVVSAVLHLGGVDQLVGTGWGRLVLVKAALFGVLALLGWTQRRRLLPQLAGDDVGHDRARQLFGQVVLVELAVMVLAFGAATQLASGIPAKAEAASRIESFAAYLGDDRQVNVTVDPAQPGANVVHVYFLDGAGGVDDTLNDPVLHFEQDGNVIVADLVPAGPGHFSALNIGLPSSGQWLVHVQATVDDEPVATSGAVTVR